VGVLAVGVLAVGVLAVGVLAAQEGLRCMHSAGCKCITARTGNRCRSVVFVTCVRGFLKYTQIQ